MLALGWHQTFWEWVAESRASSQHELLFNPHKGKHVMPQLQQTRGRFFSGTRGQPLRIQGREITPVGRLTHMTWAGGGILIHRPLAIEVRQGDTTQRYPLPGATRSALALLLPGLVLGALVLGGRRWLVLKRGAV